MKGSYPVVVQNRRVQYKFTVRRNISVLRGDSATGKMTVIDMIASYHRLGADSGITVQCKRDCVVLTGERWRENLSLIQNSIVFIDEGNPFVTTREFANAIKDSDNYYVIATRESLFCLPYSIQEIYGIKNTTRKKCQGVQRLYSEFYPLNPFNENEMAKPDLVLVEDSNSGYAFFKHLFEEHGIKCISASGNSNIYRKLTEAIENTILIIADGAAFGAEIERVLLFVKEMKKTKNIILYLPESFEWIVLKSSLISSVDSVLDDPSQFIESRLYFSWERFFTELLRQKTQETYLAYEKGRLNPVYLQKREKRRYRLSFQRWRCSILFFSKEVIGWNAFK